MARKAPRRARSRGLTLVEALITAAILSIIFAGITAALIATQRQVGMLSSQTEAQSALRMGLSQIEQALTRAGFGMDPAYAIMTATYGDTGDLQAIRDGSGPFGSDELVVHYRDPGFDARVEGADPAQLTLEFLTPGTRRLVPGERLLVLCSTGLTDADRSAYVRISNVDAAPDGAVVGLAPGEFPFNEQDLLANPCFSDGSARAYRIERHHFFISWLRTGPGTEARPALLVSRGTGDNLFPNTYGVETPDIDGGQGANNLGDAQILALDVEQLQVAYIMNSPGPAAPAILNVAPDGGGGTLTRENWIFGDDPGTREVPHLERQDAAAPFPLLDIDRVQCIQAEQADPLDGCGYGSRRRFTGHPGNIRGVRVSLASRSARPDYDALIPETQLVLDDPANGEGPMENLTSADLPPPSRHRRHRVQTTISLKNMLQQKHFIQGDELMVAAPPPAGGEVP